MSYLGISVKEAIGNINDTWFLPAIQRPYVWGSRHQNEEYICKLFDSILKGYPIGGLIIWKTSEEVPFREFITDYQVGDTQRLVDKGLHGRSDKCLIYDGQQRLQTLYSCLKHTFHGKILVYNLLFDTKNGNDPEETGFSFVEKNVDIPWYFVRMNTVFSKKVDDEKRVYRKSIFALKDDINDREEELIERNIDILWDIFVKTDSKSLAHYTIQSSNEKEVNEVFERLNTGGMALSLADILFSKLKAENYDFEEKLQCCSKNIYNSTGKGYVFSAYNILQVLYLLVKRRVRVDPKLVKENEKHLFVEAWDKLEKPLQVFFSNYLWDQFKINNNSIIPRNLGMLPIMVYFYEIYNNGYGYKNITSGCLQKINQYFIKSQVNDWNLQSYIDKFSRIIMEESSKTGDLFDFPLELIEGHIRETRKRNIEIHEQTFIGYRWFALKMLTPDRTYQFDPDIKGRFNPEIDHIFPRKLAGKDEVYAREVDVLWNLQPTKGEVNGYKSNIHPKIFFTDLAMNSKGEKIVGSKYVGEYDYMLPKNGMNQVDFNDEIWNNHTEFILERRKLMIEAMKVKYGICLIEE